MIGAVVTILETFGIPLLIQLIKSFLSNLSATNIVGADLDYLDQLVGSAESNATLTSGSAKLSWVKSQMLTYLEGQGKTIGTSLLNAVTELAVQKLNAAIGAPAASAASASAGS